MDAVEGTLAQAPPSGASGKVSRNSVTGTLLFESAHDSIRAPSTSDDFREDVHKLMKEEQDPEDVEPTIGDQAVIWGTNVLVPTEAVTFQNFLLNF